MLLEAFRNHKRWLMFIAMILVIPSFVVTGIYSYNRMISDDGAIAKVDDQSVTPAQFDEFKRKRLENLRARMGEQFRSNMLDGQDARVQLLESLMNERALTGEVRQGHVELSEEAIISIIKTLDAFQKDGKFDPKVYEAYLASAGYTDQGFVQLVRGDILRQMLIEGVSRTATAPTEVSRRLFDLLTETREVEIGTVKLSDFMKEVSATEEEAKAYWSAHQDEFRVPDTISAEYVTISPALFTNVTPSEDEIKTFYEQNQGRFARPEERSASHILIEFGDKKEEAKARAEKIMADLKAKPDTFAKVAKEVSADPGSARDGGSLGYFGRGMMVPAFETAVFDGKKGDLVGPVETEFGYHIIRIDDVKAAGEKTLEEVRPEIINLYRQEQSMKTFATEADNFTNMVYEQSDSLASVIEKYKLKPVTVDNITATGPADMSARAMLNQHVVDSLFSEECLREKRNTQAIEVSQNTLVAARVTKFAPEHVRAFEEVKDSIVMTIRTNKAMELATKSGKETIAELTKGAKSLKVKFDAPIKMARNNASQATINLVNAVMRVPADKLPAYTGVQTADGFTIARVVSSAKTEPTNEQLASLTREISEMAGRDDEITYLGELRAKHGATVLNDQYKPEAPAAAAK